MKKKPFILQYVCDSELVQSSHTSLSAAKRALKRRDDMYHCFDLQVICTLTTQHLGRVVVFVYNFNTGKWDLKEL